MDADPPAQGVKIARRITTFRDWDAAVEAFKALLAMAETGGIKLDLDNIKPRSNG